MTCSVRIFTHGGIVPVVLGANTQLASNSMFVLKQPYLASNNGTVDGTPVQLTATPANANQPLILRVEVQKGSVVHYEITNAAGSTSPTLATLNSPTIEGHELLEWGYGYTISFLLAGSEA